MSTKVKHLRVVVVGAGNMGKAHVAGWQAAEDVSVVAVADPVVPLAEALARRSGGKAFADFREAIDDTKPDVVSVCTPTHLHSEVSVFAAQRGAHVLCEKPIALTLDEADEMIQTARRCGVLLGVGFQYRHSRRLQAICEFFQQGSIGRPGIYSVRCMQTVRAKRLMHSQSVGGGPFIDNLCHWIDAWRVLFRSEVKAVAARGMTYARGKPEVRGIEDLAIDTGVALLQFASGDLAYTETTWGLPKALGDHHPQEELIGPKGIIRGGICSDEVTLITERGSRKASDLGCAIPRSERNRHFAKAVREGTLPPATGEDGRKALEVSLAILKSMETGEIVKLKTR